MRDMQRREAAHARRRRTRLAIGAAACVVLVIAGGIGIVASGALRGPAEQRPAATAGPSAAQSSTTTASRKTRSSASGRPISGFDTDPQLNQTASDIAETLTIATENEPNYAGVRIVGAGVELSVVGDLTPAESAAVDDARASGSRALADVTTVPAGSTFTITVRHVRYTMKQLSTIVDQLPSDSALAEHGITVSAVGVDEGKNVVDLSIVPYSDEVAQIIHDKYGDAVLVRTHAVEAAGS
jgi:hypothetical protein